MFRVVNKVTGRWNSLRIFVQVRSSLTRLPASTFEMKAPPQKRSVISQGLQKIMLRCLEATVVAVCRSVTKNRILRARPMIQTHLSPILCRNHLQLQYTYRFEVHSEQTPSESDRAKDLAMSRPWSLQCCLVMRVVLWTETYKANRRYQALTELIAKSRQAREQIHFHAHYGSISSFRSVRLCAACSGVSTWT